MPKVLTPEEIEVLTTPHLRDLWGTSYMVTPALVEEVFGDGEKLLILTTIMHRPDYYIVQIDSGWDLSGYGEGDTVHDHLDEIYDAIEDQFGSADGEDEEGELGDFPALSSGGSSWGEIDLEEVMRAHRRTQAMSDLTEREREILSEANYIYRKPEQGLDGYGEGWFKPMHVGGHNRSYHSRTLKQLVKKGLIEAKQCGGYSRGSKRYRITELALQRFQWIKDGGAVSGDANVAQETAVSSSL